MKHILKHILSPLGYTKKAFLLIFLFATMSLSYAQLSPGELSEAHAHLEGLSNCTKCHILGDKVANEKCLDCHKELKSQIDKNKGYHSSNEVSGKDCVKCHNDHHGRKFEMIRFDKDQFDHKLTGYNLEGAHDKLKCEKCHKTEFIKDSEIKKKKSTFLGLQTDCLNCHEDYHQKSLSTDCFQCHTFDAFKPVTKFDHNKAKFKLVGKHLDVSCEKCHIKSEVNGKVVQQFTGIKFQSCTNCHKDIHENKFGQNCTQCHNEFSFLNIKDKSGFDHNKTNYRLEDKHKTVDCKKCHKIKLTDPVKHNYCLDCHTDYHKGDFVKQGKNTDCAECHTTKGFVGSKYTIERHKDAAFQLEGAHMATPCFVCHQKEDTWKFKKIGTQCVDCHDNIHKTFIDEKYIPEQNCKTCHTVNQWGEVNFDHSKTNYQLQGKHKEQTCRACHFKANDEGIVSQKFKYSTNNCTECHIDEHHKQFEKEGITDCLRCHNNEKWKFDQFDHSKTKFPLDGKHINVACVKCHQKVQDGPNTYVKYILNKSKCEDCH